MNERLARARGAQALDYWFGQLVSADADMLGEELDDAHEAKLHLMLEGARGEDVHLEAFLAGRGSDHRARGRGEGAKSPSAHAGAGLRKAAVAEIVLGSGPKSATKAAETRRSTRRHSRRPKSATEAHLVRVQARRD